MRQIRDCVYGSDAIKRQGEMYLPMPSGMNLVTSDQSSIKTSTNALADKTLPINQAPWYHGNPAYSAYVHRAKFPDMTANTLRGLVGLATREEADVKVPGGVDYLEEVATIDGDNLLDLFKDVLSELFQVGRHTLVVDVRSDNTLYFAQYASESYVNWLYEVIDGQRVQTYAEFETCEYNDKGEETKKSLCYALEVPEEGDNAGKRIAVCYKYTDGALDEDGRTELLVQGKPFERLPVVNIGAEKNTAEPDALPLIGVSDCALDIYRHSADLNQNQYQSCNPTLVFTGVDEKDAPRVIGSTVAVCLSDPNSDGKYMTTDTSALSHVYEYMRGIFEEAIAYGAQLLGPTKRAAESAEALALRQASSGATLVGIVTQAGRGIEDGLKLAAELAGAAGEAKFEPNLEFAELTLTGPEMTALLNSWMSGGISHLSYLENMAAAGKLGGRTPEQEQALIDDEGPVGDATGKPTLPGNDLDEEDDDDDEEDDNDAST